VTTENTTSTQAWRELSAEFTAWTIWTSDAGRWWATTKLTWEENRAGRNRTVDADNPEELRAALAAQEELRNGETPFTTGDLR
jgi:hypothetical protein